MFLDLAIVWANKSLNNIARGFICTKYLVAKLSLDTLFTQAKDAVWSKKNDFSRAERQMLQTALFDCGLLLVAEFSRLRYDSVRLV